MNAKFILPTCLFGLLLIVGCTGLTGGAVTGKTITCNSPYILVGDACCLDENHNSVCDKDESITECINNDGTCPSSCYATNDNDCTNCPTNQVYSQGTCVTPDCSRNSDCYDGNSCTKDICKNMEQSNAYCSNIAIIPCCGNTICEEVEAYSNCPNDCEKPMPILNIMFENCDTGFDLFNLMGEVTNVYIKLKNIGNAKATNVVLTAYANDEDNVHPDKTKTVGIVMPGDVIEGIKLTVDTLSNTKTTVRVRVTTNEGVGGEIEDSGCVIDKDQITLIGEQIWKLIPFI